MNDHEDAVVLLSYPEKAFGDAKAQERVRYIPYTMEDKAAETEAGFRAYPQEWQYHDGLNCLMRKRRDDAISAITENDILNPGIVTENPLIGELPSRQAILDELDDAKKEQKKKEPKPAYIDEVWAQLKP